MDCASGAALAALVGGSGEVDRLVDVVLLDVGQDRGVYGEALGITAGGKLPGRRVVVVQCQADLLQVVRALHASGRFADLLHGGKQQADQDRDDGDDHEQFDEREARAVWSLSES